MIALFLNSFLSFQSNGRLWRAAEFGRFCRGEMRNFVSWLAAFGKIYPAKLWALLSLQIVCIVSFLC